MLAFFYSKAGKCTGATVIMPVHLLLFYLWGFWFFFTLILRKICIIINYFIRKWFGWNFSILGICWCPTSLLKLVSSKKRQVEMKYHLWCEKRLVLMCTLQHFRLKSLQTASRKGRFGKIKFIFVPLLKWYIQKSLTKSALGNYCSIEAFLCIDLSPMAENLNTLSGIAFFVY